MKVEFSRSAFRELKKFPKEVQKRIVNKIEFYIKQKDPLMFAEHITNFPFGDYRFRIGGYRVIFDVIKNTIFILKIGHRKDVYR